MNFVFNSLSFLRNKMGLSQQLIFHFYGVSIFGFNQLKNPLPPPKKTPQKQKVYESIWDTHDFFLAP